MATLGPLGAAHHLLDVALQVFASPEIAAERLVEARRPDRALSVFTCNVDHVMLMRADPGFRAAYGRADVVTIDGAPLALLARWTGRTDACRVTGVDLTAALLQLAAGRRLRIALIGGAPDRARAAAAAVRYVAPEMPEIFTDSPRMDFDIGDEEDDRLVSALRAHRPEIVVVCFGAPKQELWIDRHRDDLPGAVVVGAGATVDYLSGEVRRAPAVFQRTGTEAFYRLATDFPRLWRRYLVRDSRFVGVFLHALVRHLAGTAGPAPGQPHPAVPTPRAGGRHRGDGDEAGPDVPPQGSPAVRRTEADDASSTGTEATP